MIKTKTELLEQIKLKLGEDTSDETISLIEDISDTLSDYETKTADNTNWKEKYEQNDAEWRNKYKERFFKSDGNEEVIDETEEEETKTPLRFEDLFTEEKE